MKKKIIIFSLHYKPYIGGAEIFLEELCKRSRYDITIITRKGPASLNNFETQNNITIYRVGGNKYDKYYYPILAYLKAIKLQKKYNFNIVHSIMANHAGLAGMWFSNKTKLPFLLNLQIGQTDETIKKKSGLFYNLYLKIYKSATKIQAISNFLKDRAIKLGVNSKKIIVIPNGVDMHKFITNFSKKEINEMKQKYNINKNDKVLVTTSRLSKKNGVGDVIDAIKIINNPNIKFIIFGTGELEKELKNKVKTLHLNNQVIFAGHIEHKDLPKYLSIGDIFIRPSLSEGQGISFIEAMACKIPVIATPVGGIPDFLTEGETGYFCEQKNPRSIANTIEKAFKNNNEEIVNNAYILVKEKYQWDNIIKDIENIYEEL